MKLFLDTEFNEYRGELISLALVGDTGDFYVELEMSETPGSWVAEHVIPRLIGDARPRYEAQLALQVFLNDQWGEIEIVADWPDDIKYFCEFLVVGPGKCIKTPPLKFVLLQNVDYQSVIPHNALWDARAIREWYKSRILAA